MGACFNRYIGVFNSKEHAIANVKYLIGVYDRIDILHNHHTLRSSEKCHQSIDDVKFLISSGVLYPLVLDEIIIIKLSLLFSIYINDLPSSISFSFYQFSLPISFLADDTKCFPSSSPMQMHPS